MLQSDIFYMMKNRSFLSFAVETGGTVFAELAEVKQGYYCRHFLLWGRGLVSNKWEMEQEEQKVLGCLTGLVRKTSLCVGLSYYKPVFFFFKNMKNETTTDPKQEDITFQKRKKQSDLNNVFENDSSFFLYLAIKYNECRIVQERKTLAGYLSAIEFVMGSTQIPN